MARPVQGARYRRRVRDVLLGAAFYLIRGWAKMEVPIGRQISVLRSLMAITVDKAYAAKIEMELAELHEEPQAKVVAAAKIRYFLKSLNHLDERLSKLEKSVAVDIEEARTSWSFPGDL